MYHSGVGDIDLEFLDFHLGRKEKETIAEISNSILENQNIESDNDSNNCKYYDIDKFIQGKFVENNYFSILHQNIHPVLAHRRIQTYDEIYAIQL